MPACEVGRRLVAGSSWLGHVGVWGLGRGLASRLGGLRTILGSGSNADTEQREQQKLVCCATEREIGPGIVLPTGHCTPLGKTYLELVGECCGVCVVCWVLPLTTLYTKLLRYSVPVPVKGKVSIDCYAKVDQIEKKSRKAHIGKLIILYLTVILNNIEMLKEEYL